MNHSEESVRETTCTDGDGGTSTVPPNTGGDKARNISVLSLSLSLGW